MPRLYCTEHGKQHESRCQQEQENYRWLGETVLIVSGQLKSGPWQCDGCNAPLKRSQKVWLMTAFPSHFAEELERYDYACERQYFNMERAKVTVYGAEPPGGIPSPASVLEAG